MGYLIRWQTEEPGLVPNHILDSIFPIFLGLVIIITGIMVTITASVFINNLQYAQQIRNKSHKISIPRIAGGMWMFAGLHILYYMIQSFLRFGDYGTKYAFGYNTFCSIIYLYIYYYSFPFFLIVSGIVLFILTEINSFRPTVKLSWNTRINRIIILRIACWLWIVAGIGFALQLIREEFFQEISRFWLFEVNFFGFFLWAIPHYGYPFFIVMTGVALLIISKKVVLEGNREDVVSPLLRLGETETRCKGDYLRQDRTETDLAI